MKKLSKLILLVTAVSLFTAASSHAQIIVRVRPVRPSTIVVTDRPPSPSPRHIWVAEGWRVDGGRYVYRPGYWALPPRYRTHWVTGHWRDTRHRGSIWIEGHWA